MRLEFRNFITQDHNIMVFISGYALRYSTRKTNDSPLLHHRCFRRLVFNFFVVLMIVLFGISVSQTKQSDNKASLHLWDICGVPFLIVNKGKSQRIVIMLFVVVVGGGGGVFVVVVVAAVVVVSLPRSQMSVSFKNEVKLYYIPCQMHER